MAFINIRRSCNFFLSTVSFKTSRFCFKYILRLKFGTKTMAHKNAAYFQQCEGEEKVNITIHYCHKNNDFNINRIFYFERKMCENVEVFLQRLDQKVQDALERKIKKAKRKNEELINLKTCTEKLSCLLLNDQQLPNALKFNDIFQNTSNQKLKLRIFDVDYNVHLNSPMIMNMTLPKLILVGTYVGPETIVSQFTDKSKSDFIWYKSLSGFENSWEKCGEKYLYLVKEEDQNYFLKLMCIPKMNEKIGPAFEVVSKTPVEGFLNLEEIKKRHEYTKERTKPNEIRIISYNILADTYTQTKEAKTHLFKFCDPIYMDINYRKNLLNVELVGYKADIMCLQEVDVKLYEQISHFFNNFGYTCIFHEKEGGREGCLFLYDRHKFNFISANQYIFSKELLSNPLFVDIKVKLQDNEKLIQRLNNVLSQIQVIVLEYLPKDFLVIGNTHFYFHPDADHIRLLQGILSWKILLNTVEEVKKKDPNKRVSILMCGDLNSTPKCGFHQLLTTGSVGSDHIGWKSKGDEGIKGIDYRHSVNMKSVYDNTQYTNFTPLFKGCIDYIYYQTDHLELKQAVPIPSEDILGRHCGIPSKYFPSDHVALIADLKFKDEK